MTGPPEPADAARQTGLGTGADPTPGAVGPDDVGELPHGADPGTLQAEIRRRRRALQARNPLHDREGWLSEFRELVTLQARLRDVRD